MNWSRFFLACFFGSLVTTIIGSIISTHRVIEAAIPLNDVFASQMTTEIRLSTILDDILGLGPIFLLFIMIAFVIAMRSAISLASKKPDLTLPLFLGAGFVAMPVLLSSMKFAFFNVDIIAGARDLTGYFLMALAGLIGAFIVYKIYKPALRAT